VQVWDSQTGTLISIYRGHGKWVRSLDWSPTGNQIASASDHTVHVWHT
jgi:WD40 repeat protein